MITVYPINELKNVLISLRNNVYMGIDLSVRRRKFNDLDHLYYNSVITNKIKLGNQHFSETDKNLPGLAAEEKINCF